MNVTIQSDSWGAAEATNRSKTNTKFAWQRGFGAFSVSFSKVDQFQNYIQNQQEHHEKISFADEFRQLLVRHGIEFDERILFEVEHIV